MRFWPMLTATLTFAGCVTLQSPQVRHKPATEDELAGVQAVAVTVRNLKAGVSVLGEHGGLVSLTGETAAKLVGQAEHLVFAEAVLARGNTSGPLDFRMANASDVDPAAAKLEVGIDSLQLGATDGLHPLVSLAVNFRAELTLPVRSGRTAPERIAAQVLMVAPGVRTLKDWFDNEHRGLQASLTELSPRAADVLLARVLPAELVPPGGPGGAPRKAPEVGPEPSGITPADALPETTYTTQDDKSHAGKKAARGAGSGALQGFLRGTGEGLRCGPFAPVCAILVVPVLTVGGAAIGATVNAAQATHEAQARLVAEPERSRLVAALGDHGRRRELEVALAVAVAGASPGQADKVAAVVGISRIQLLGRPGQGRTFPTVLELEAFAHPQQGEERRFCLRGPLADATIWAMDDGALLAGALEAQVARAAPLLAEALAAPDESPISGEGSCPSRSGLGAPDPDLAPQASNLATGERARVKN